MSSLSSLLSRARPVAAPAVAGAVAVAAALAIVTGTFAVGRSSPASAFGTVLIAVGILAPLCVTTRRAGPRATIVCFLLAAAASAGLIREAGNAGSRVLLVAGLAVALGMCVLATLVNADEASRSTNRF